MTQWHNYQAGHLNYLRVPPKSLLIRWYCCRHSCVVFNDFMFHFSQERSRESWWYYFNNSASIKLHYFEILRNFLVQFLLNSWTVKLWGLCFFSQKKFTDRLTYCIVEKTPWWAEISQIFCSICTTFNRKIRIIRKNLLHRLHR